MFFLYYYWKWKFRYNTNNTKAEQNITARDGCIEILYIPSTLRRKKC
jgi:hypothetical protein